MIVFILIQKIISLFIILLAGVLLVRTGIASAEDTQSLSKLSVYLFMPCSILNAFQVDCTPEVQKGLMLSYAAAILVHIVLMVLIPVLRRLFTLDAVEQVSIMYSNAGNLIIPLVTAMLGAEWVIYCSGFISVQLFLLWSHGKAVLCGERSLDLKKVLSNVNMISIFMGLFLFITGLRLGGPVGDAVDSLASILGPAAMLIAGMLVGNMDLKPMIRSKQLWQTTALRLLLCPLIMLVLLKGLAAVVPVENAANILLITLLATMTPSASTVTQMAQIYGKNADYASAINLVTTLCCVFTMPLMVALYQL